MASSPGNKSSQSPEISDIEGKDDKMIDSSPTQTPKGAAVGAKPRLDKAALQDKNRVKRKKAKRACNNCQRAHLTCDDNRPCERCIARGLSHDCQDGVRKKAKYLHDAPDEALRPNARRSSDYTNNDPANVRQIGSFITTSDADTQPAIPDIQRQDSFTFSQTPTAAPMSTQLDNSPPFNIYGGQGQPQLSQFSPPQQPALTNLASDPMQSMPAPVGDSRQFNEGLVDPNDPSLFNFDLASMNFGSHYGALEFGMLSHMSSGFNDAYMQSGQHRNSSTSYDAANLSNTGFVESPTDHNGFALGTQKSHVGWPSNQSPGTMFAQYHPGQESMRRASFMGPYGYTMGAGPPSMSEQSPGSATLDQFGASFADPSAATNQPQAAERSAAPYNTMQSPPLKENKGRDGKRSTTHEYTKSRKKLDRLPQASKVVVERQRRDPSTIYSAVTKPYPYTAGFHTLTTVLQRRFSSQKRLAIAQALASIRPSFISCTRTLIDQDLIFMERCFQRQLFEYENFVNSCGTPTLICRRTGEIAYVGEEFTTLTGWRKEVLLGKEPNANINKPAENRSGTATASSSRGGFNTPRVTADGTKLDSAINGGSVGSGNNNQASESRFQAVFLAELLDDDSVVQFYEDFAKLAFADSKGKAISPCKLLKYKTKEDTSTSSSSSGGAAVPPHPGLSPPSRGSITSNSSSVAMNSDHKNSSRADLDTTELAAPTGRSKQASESGVPNKKGRAKSSSDRVSPSKPGADSSGKIAGPAATGTSTSSKGGTVRNGQQSKSRGGHATGGHELLISGEEGLQRLGEPEGKIDCMYCWTVKRDVFDIPMLVVINFLPIVSDWPDGP